MHLVNAAKKFTEIMFRYKVIVLQKQNLFIDPDKVEREFAKKKVNFNKINIVLGIGSSGPTTRNGESDNYI